MHSSNPEAAYGSGPNSHDHTLPAAEPPRGILWLNPN